MIQTILKDHSWRNAVAPATFGDHHRRNTVIRAIFTVHQGALLEPCLGHFQWNGRRLLACFMLGNRIACATLYGLYHIRLRPNTAVFRNCCFLIRAKPCTKNSLLWIRQFQGKKRYGCTNLAKIATINARVNPVATQSRKKQTSAQ